MAGVNDLIAFGFGSWSTVVKVPTWGSGIGASGFTPVSHYHAIEGPSKKLHVLTGPSGERYIIEGPSKKLHVLTGAD